MTNPQDPRTPQERAYSLDESHDETRVLHTSDPTEAYGRPQPTQALPPYGQAPGQGYQQGYQPTQQFSPTEQYRQYQPEQQYQPTQQYGYGPGGPGVPPGPSPTPEPREPRRRRWLLPALAALVVIALAAVVGYLLSGGSGNDAPTASAPTTAVAPPPAATRTQPPTLEPSLPPTLPLDRLPGGLGDAIGSNGTTIGTITANDGSSITISGIGGTIVTVRMTPETQIIALAGSSPSALRVGDTVLAQGTPVRDGEMTADTIVSATVPGFNRSGN